MTQKELLECSASLVGGAAIGAALMYLLDPQSGEDRREYLAKVAADTVHGGSDTLADTWHSVASGASGMASNLVDRVRGIGSDAASHASEAADDYTRSARRYGSSWLSSMRDARDDASHRARHAGRGLVRSVRSRLPEHFGGYHETHASTIAGLSLAAVGCLAFGAGLMYFLDPDRGRGRRAWAKDKGMKYARQTGEAVQGYGQHVANKAKGLAADTRSAAGSAYDATRQATSNAMDATRNAASSAMDSTRAAASSAMDSAKQTGQQLVDKVKTALGKMKGAKDVKVNDNAGRLTLTGTAQPHEVDLIITTCRTAGATDIDNRLNQGKPVGSTY